MADYCKQCSSSIFGKDYEDLSQLMTKEEAEQGLMVSVICEGCGFIQVNQSGECVSQDCLEKGHKEAHSALS